MLNSRILLSAGLAALALAFNAPARAEIITFTYTGTIVSGVGLDDENGWFGAVAAPLDGLAIALSYSFDPSTLDDEGGTYYVTAAGQVALTVTVNGLSHTVYSPAPTSNQGNDTQISYYDYYGTNLAVQFDRSTYTFVRGPAFPADGSLPTNLAGTISSDSQQYREGGEVLFANYQTFTATTTGADDAAVPEPMTASLFAAVGLSGLMRDRRRRAGSA